MISLHNKDSKTQKIVLRKMYVKCEYHSYFNRLRCETLAQYFPIRDMDYFKCDLKIEIFNLMPYVSKVTAVI